MKETKLHNGELNVMELLCCKAVITKAQAKKMMWEWFK